MTALNQSTQRRLKKIQQTPSVWEGDRRTLTGLTESLEIDGEGKGECIIWVDGSEGVVRAMDMVSTETGLEAVVRTLLRAIEHPHSPARPARPQKIVVRDREIQFFLRGALQHLDINIDYVPDLPLIDELFRGFAEVASTRPPKLPPAYAEALMDKAFEIWEDAPWDLLADHNVIAIELNQWDIGTLYVSIMGMLGMEYGLVLYRSLDSLKRFRAAVLAEESFEQLEEAFLGQDCLFLNFEREDEEFDEEDLSTSDLIPKFGTVHPFEGMRPFLYEEEAQAVYVALEALHRFFNASYRQLEANPASAIAKRYRVALPKGVKATTVPVQVSTEPDLATELLEMASASEGADLGDFSNMTVPLRDDLVPEGALCRLEVLSWELVEKMVRSSRFYQGGSISQSGLISLPQTKAGEGFPVVLIQTSRPKAKTLIESIQRSGGLRGICFNPGEDPLDGDRYDLGILQTENAFLYLFGEFLSDDPDHGLALQQWERVLKTTKGYCGLAIAKGLTGASRGNPQLNDLMALWEGRSLSTEELGLGLLQLMPQFDEFELD